MKNGGGKISVLHGQMFTNIVQLALMWHYVKIKTGESSGEMRELWKQQNLQNSETK